MKKRNLLLATAAVVAMGAVATSARAQDAVKIGVLTDLSGTYSDISGQGSVIATKMAIDDFLAKEKPAFKVELLSADHQNKADIAANKAREWFEKDGVDLVTDLVTSSTALAASKIAKEKNKIAIVNGAATTALTNKECNDVTIHYTYDTYALANGTAGAVSKQPAGKTWYFLTADYAFGHSLEADSTAVVEANGGKVLGSSRHPFPGSDFSAFLLKAQASGAQIIGLANAGNDTTNSIKQAAEFGITPKQALAGLLIFITDINSLGLKATQGMYLTEAFYWDLNDETRAWSKRFFDIHKKMPTMVHAGQYSSTYQYLAAIKKAGTKDTAKVMETMKAATINDFFAKNGKIREDGRMVHDMYLFQVKKPEESKAQWDYYKVSATIPAAQAFQPLEKSACPLVKK